MHWRALLLVLWLGACGGSPEQLACLDACNAQNKCAGVKQQNCGGLCHAIPRDCTKEFSNYWLCADAHLAEACSSFSDCSDPFAKLASCITAYCIVYPLDASCYY
ncbi:MAG TPA: hypothetical protein VFF06_16135 [Polyangia bacterium]|nr:hypothetical protein [Polyangia bacterium]